MKILIPLLMLVLSGCASMNGGQVFGDMKAEGASDGGYLVTSLTRDISGEKHAMFSSISIVFRNIETGDNGVLSFFPGMFDDQTREDIVDGNKLGTTVAWALKPGRYEIYGFKFHLNLGLSERWWEQQEEFSMPFEIVKGQATCLPGFHAYGVWGESIFGLKDVVGGYFELLDNSQENMKRARKLVADLPEQCTQNSLDVPPQLHQIFQRKI